jgi:hypothetical protein
MEAKEGENERGKGHTAAPDRLREMESRGDLDDSNRVHQAADRHGDDGEPIRVSGGLAWQ